MIYSSLDNQKIKDIKKLRQKKYRDAANLFLVEGEHLVIEAFKSGYLKCVIYEEGAIPPVDSESLCVTSKVMHYLSDLDNYQPIMGLCMKKQEQELGSRILVLDNIQDPGNLGTIIRSAVAFNFDSIILSEDTVDLYNSKVVRASQGLLFHINIVVRQLKDTILELKKRDYTIIGTKVDNGSDIKSYKDVAKIVLVMGNEGQGVSKDILDLCDHYAYISMNNKCESLNVGVATSIMLYELNSR